MSVVSHLRNGTLGFGITNGGWLGDEIGIGLATGKLVGSGDVWITGVGLGRAATGGVAPFVQAASKATENPPQRSLKRLMTS